MAGTDSRSVAWLWWLLGIGILAATFWAQCKWFESNYRQPVIYDAADYVALARQLELDGPIPRLPSGGFRTYAYPLLLRPFVENLSPKLAERWVYRFQFLLLGSLLISLRWTLLPGGPTADVCLVVSMTLLPVLLPYCVVLLSDLSGLVFLQLALLVLALAFRDCRAGGAAFRSGLTGALLGFTIQIRPAYYHLTWLVLLDVVWNSARDSATPQPPFFIEPFALCVWSAHSLRAIWPQARQRWCRNSKEDAVRGSFRINPCCSATI